MTMVEPEKPFACSIPECGMTFTNEDHLNVHTRKHDMVLQFGCEQKAAVFVADQTPTPTRFIRNCEEVGLFQDLQNVNPFDEGFKRAIETKQGLLSLEGCTSSEELHTPQMFPLLDGDSVYQTTNNQRNITISRSSSDETGAIKEFETTRISKLTNEVTTISRIVEKHDDTPKHKETLKNSVSYTNNVIKIHSNIAITKDAEDLKDNKDTPKDVYERLQVDVPPIMSQKSIDFVVDSLTSDYTGDKNIKDVSNANVKINKDGRSVKDKELKSNDGKNKNNDYEVILKLPSGREIKLVNAEESKEKHLSINPKELLKKVITDKVESQKLKSSFNIPTIANVIASGTLIPVSIVNTNLATTNLVNTNLANATFVTTNLVNTNYTPKLPLRVFDKRPVRRKCPENYGNISKEGKKSKISPDINVNCNLSGMESRSAASRRYRAKLKETMLQQCLENKQLKEVNDKLVAEKSLLQDFIIEHIKRCHCPEDLRELKEKIRSFETNNKF